MVSAHRGAVRRTRLDHPPIGQRLCAVLPLLAALDRGGGPVMEGELEPVLGPLRGAFEAERLQNLQG
jgi:hypothetical protein